MRLLSWIFVDKLKYLNQVIKVKGCVSIDDETLKKLGFVMGSTYRVKAVSALDNEIKIPTQIVRDTGIRTNHISKVLSELKNEELVECINEDAKKGRLYRLTSTGQEIADEMK